MVSDGGGAYYQNFTIRSKTRGYKRLDPQLKIEPFSSNS